MNTESRLILLTLILIVASFFRIWHLAPNPTRADLSPPQPLSTPPSLFSDEAINGNNAFEALTTGDFKVFYRENNGREGFYINLQALSIAIFGNTSFALRIVSALFGILSVLALYLFTKEYTRSDSVALFASFFLAVSFWHVMFSRIGFRAIMAPFFLTIGLWGMYYVWNRVSERPKAKLVFVSALGGLLFGLGFHSYIAYRVAPVVFLPILWLFYKKARETRDHCIICLPAIFIFFAIITFVPLGLYFIDNPSDFFGRTSQISILSSDNPFTAFIKNSATTVQMFYYAGDFNPRHNRPGMPALWWPVALLFTLGIFIAWRRKYGLLFLWFFAMLLPVAFSSEALPHALRAIIMIPPVMIFAALGMQSITHVSLQWLKVSEIKYIDAASIIKRIQKAFPLLVLAILLAMVAQTYNVYFQKWSIHPDTREAFGNDLYAIGTYLKNEAPSDIPKYVVTNEVESIDITGRPMTIQAIVFATETYKPKPLGAHNIHYITTKDTDRIDCTNDCMIIPVPSIQVNSINQELRKAIPGFEDNFDLHTVHNLLIFKPNQ